MNHEKTPLDVLSEFDELSKIVEESLPVLPQATSATSARSISAEENESLASVQISEAYKGSNLEDPKLIRALMKLKAGPAILPAEIPVITEYERKKNSKNILSPK